jgi:branched-chain amino acid transport system substrate-binding protein
MTSQAKKPRWLLAACLLSILALVATACGGSGDDNGTTAQPSDGATTTDGATDTGGSGEGDDVVRLGILGECEGPFGGFHEDTVAGVTLALVNHAGATPTSETTALDGWSGAEVNGTPIELTGIGCGGWSSSRTRTSSSDPSRVTRASPWRSTPRPTRT